MHAFNYGTKINRFLSRHAKDNVTGAKLYFISSLSQSIRNEDNKEAR